MTVPPDIAYRLGQVEQVLREEQASLWYDLKKAIRSAINGVWSMVALIRTDRETRYIRSEGE